MDIDSKDSHTSTDTDNDSRQTSQQCDVLHTYRMYDIHTYTYRIT